MALWLARCVAAFGCNYAMPCYKPLTAWRTSERTPAGKSGITFNKNHAVLPGDPLELPCGQCIGCRLKRSREWAIRCVHEAQLHQNNCFITLTFNEEELQKRTPFIGPTSKPDERRPAHQLSLDKAEFPKFMKRLRKHFGYEKIRFFHCGEYGDRYHRPHYHAILFGLDFEDKYLFKMRNGNPLYRSPTLEKLWKFGYSSIGSVTFESAAYVARYVMKKATGLDALDNYYAPDENTGELVQVLEEEYTTMSRRPGIASDWFDEFNGDLFPKDFITVNGRKMSAPRYYDRKAEDLDHLDFELIKSERKAKAKEHQENCTPERLAIREKVQQYKLNRLVRNLDHE